MQVAFHGDEHEHRQGLLRAARFECVPASDLSTLSRIRCNAQPFTGGNRGEMVFRPGYPRSPDEKKPAEAGQVHNIDKESL